MVKNITDNEVVTIAAIIANLPEFIDQEEVAWRLNLTQAGLKDLVGKLSLSGGVKTVAFSVITQLQYYAPLEDYPEDSVLGRFLCQILTIPYLSSDDGTIIKTVIKTYNLAPSFLKE